MARTQTELRVFISSTFHDLQEEREYLVKRVFPEIRMICRERGVEFTEIDLRWGLTEEEATHGKIIRTCLEEIDRCRPYFIGILGDRYGWSPKFHEVQKDAELIRRYPWIEDAAADGASIIDMEFEYGVLQNPAHAIGSYFYFKHSNGLDPSETEQSHRLEALKKRTRASRRPVREFSSPAELGESVRADLTRLIEVHWHKDSTPSELEVERSAHEAFSTTRRRAYIVNPAYLHTFSEFVSSTDEQSLMMIAGPSGSGKSSLIAYLANYYQRRNPEAFVIAHYIGASTSTADHSGILRHICMEIRERMGIDEPIPTGIDELNRNLPGWLARVADIPVVIFIDALNQLEGAVARGLSWLPTFLPKNIKLVCSTTPGECYDTIAAAGPRILTVQPLDEDERESIIVRFLGEFHKGLSLDQTNRIAADPKSSMPLFLRTMLEELRLVGDFDKLDASIEHYLGATDTADLFKRVLERIESDYAPQFVRQFMSLIWASRRGLSESELLDLLGDQTLGPDERPMVRIDLSLLLSALDFHLVRKDGLLGFFHDYLRDAVETRYLPTLEEQQAQHRKLAAYFATLPVAKRRLDEEPWQWEHAEDWDAFNRCLTDIPILEQLLEEERVYELIRYWVVLREQLDLVQEYKFAVERWENGSTPPMRLASLYSRLGRAFFQAGGYDPAEHFLRRSLDIFESTKDHDDMLVAEVLNQLGEVLNAKGEYDRAEAMFNQILSIYRQHGAERSIKSAQALANLGTLHYNRGNLDSAEQLFNQALEIYDYDREGGRADTHSIGVVSDLAAVYFAQQKLDEAEQYALKALRLKEDLLGKDHPGTTNDINNLATILIQKEQYEAALPLVKRAIDINRRTYGIFHPEPAYNYTTLGYLYNRMSFKEQAQECYLQALEINRRIKGETHPETAISMSNLARLYQDSEEWANAAALYHQAFTVRTECLGSQHADTLRSLERLASLVKLAPPAIREGILRDLEISGLFLAETRGLESD